MKRKRLSLAVAALIAAGGLWFTRSTWRPNADAPSRGIDNSSMDIGVETSHDQSKPGQAPHPPARLAPPNPTRRFIEFTPEQRVEFARKGHGPGG